MRSTAVFKDLAPAVPLAAVRGMDASSLPVDRERCCRNAFDFEVVASGEHRHKRGRSETGMMGQIDVGKQKPTFGTNPESYFLDMMEMMEKQRSRKDRKSTEQPVDKEKGPYAIREAGTGYYLLPSNTRLKDVLVHQKEGRDYVIVANPSRMDDDVTDDVLIETISRQAVSHQERSLPDSAIDPFIARATEVIGDRQEAMRWLGTPVRGLDFATPISLLATEEGQMRVNDILGQMEHGIW